MGMTTTHKTFEKTCEQCDNSFTAGRSYVKFCSASCAATYGNVLRYGLKKEKTTTPCETCGTTPEEVYATGRFCSSNCAKSYSTSKNREAISQKVSETLKKHQEDLLSAEDVPPCEICGIIPTKRHASGKYCFDCAYKVVSRANIKNHELNLARFPKEKLLPKKRESWTWFSNARKQWEEGDKHNTCLSCSRSFAVTWDTKHHKCCSDECRRLTSSSTMIRRNIEGNFYQSFGRRVRYTERGQDIHCDSLIEWCALEHLFQTYGDRISSVSRSSLRIPYEIDEKQKLYNPDFDVCLDDGTKLVVECKSEQSGRSEIWVRYHKETVLKKDALEKWCEENASTAVWFTQKTRSDLYRNLKDRRPV